MFSRSRLATMAPFIFVIQWGLVRCDVYYYYDELVYHIHADISLWDIIIYMSQTWVTAGPILVIVGSQAGEIYSPGMKTVLSGPPWTVGRPLQWSRAVAFWCTLSSLNSLPSSEFVSTFPSYSDTSSASPPPPASLSGEISSAGLSERRTFYSYCCWRIVDEVTYAMLHTAIKSYLSAASVPASVPAQAMCRYRV